MKKTEIIKLLFLATCFVVCSFLAACNEPDPRLGEVIRIEQRNTRTCNFYVRPLDGGSEVVVQNGCDHHRVGDIIEIP
jgi:hypothetical protein